MSVPDRIYVIVAGDGRMVDASTDLNQQLVDAEDYADEFGGTYEVHPYVPASYPTSVPASRAEADRG